MAVPRLTVRVLAIITSLIVVVTVFFNVIQSHNLITKTVQNVSYNSYEDQSSKSVFMDQNNNSNNNKVKTQEYIPADVEDYIMNNFEKLGYNKTGFISGCELFRNPNITNDAIHQSLKEYRQELPKYFEALNAFNSSKTKGLLDKIRYGTYDRTELCKHARVHPDGVQAFFPSKQLSMTKSGYVEPLIPPFRNPQMCDYDYFNKPVFLSPDFFVHDFEAICLNLKPTSRTVLIDMGAALDFHGRVKSPIFKLINTFEKFGLPFDHIYAFEIVDKDAKKVFQQQLPVEYMSSYHWINAGVSAEKDNKMNPLTSIVKQFNEDDFILVKLDIDTPDIELPMAQLLLEDDSINKLVDHFYFEHHIMIYELRMVWGKSAKGNFKETLELMNGLRKKGVASHYWP